MAKKARAKKSRWLHARCTEDDELRYQTLAALLDITESEAIRIAFLWGMTTVVDRMDAVTKERYVNEYKRAQKLAEMQKARERGSKIYE